MLSKVIGIKKIIGIIILGVISVEAFTITYNRVYHQTVAEQQICKKIERKQKLSHKVWVAKITNAGGNLLNELVELDKDYKLDSTTLKLISELANKFKVKPNKVIEALGMIDLSAPSTTKQRINLTLKKQRDKLYWLETKYANQQAPYIKERKEIITMCQIELELLNKAIAEKEIQEKLQLLRAKYISVTYPRLYPWKKEAKEG